MKISTVLAGFAWAASAGLCPVAAQESAVPAVTEEYAEASAVGVEVQKALGLANERGLAGLVLREATWSVETGTVVDRELKLHFIIFTISHRSEKRATQVTTLKFKRLPPKVAAAKGPGGRASDLTEPLARAIEAAARVAAEVKELPLAEARMKIEFAVARSDKGGIEFRIAGADGDFGGDFKHASKNELELTFVSRG